MSGSSAGRDPQRAPAGGRSIALQGEGHTIVLGKLQKLCYSDFMSLSYVVKWPWVKHFPMISFDLQFGTEMDSGHQSSRNNLPRGLWMKMTANTMGTRKAILSFLNILVH